MVCVAAADSCDVSYFHAVTQNFRLMATGQTTQCSHQGRTFPNGSYAEAPDGTKWPRRFISKKGYEFPEQPICAIKGVVFQQDIAPGRVLHSGQQPIRFHDHYSVGNALMA